MRLQPLVDCSHVSKKIDGWEFIIPMHVKNSRPYHPPRKIYFGRCSLRGEMPGALLSTYNGIQHNTDETSNIFCPISVHTILSEVKPYQDGLDVKPYQDGWSGCQLYRTLY